MQMIDRFDLPEVTIVFDWRIKLRETNSIVVTDLGDILCNTQTKWLIIRATVSVHMFITKFITIAQCSYGKKRQIWSENRNCNEKNSVSQAQHCIFFFWPHLFIYANVLNQQIFLLTWNWYCAWIESISTTSSGSCFAVRSSQVIVIIYCTESGIDHEKYRQKPE